MAETRLQEWVREMESRLVESLEDECPVCGPNPDGMNRMDKVKVWCGPDGARFSVTCVSGHHLKWENRNYG